jgi:menaquinone-dependent protoporphyrinogen oxidase
MVVLIAYMSAKGSTEEIAQRINSIIESKGISTELLPIEQVSDLSKYSAAVIGSAVHNFEWLPPAQSFLHDNSSALSKIPVWAFSVGCPATMPVVFKKVTVQEQEHKLAEDLKRDLKVRGHVLFEGKFLKEHFGYVLRTLWSCFGGTYGDFRNWNRVEEWANKLADELRPL